MSEQTDATVIRNPTILMTSLLAFLLPLAFAQLYSQL
jgi:hypothetical protein